MAKKKHDMKKTERVQHLMDLFRDHGCLDKVEVDQRLSARTGIPVKDLRQSTYRDLRELVDLGRLHERRRMANGSTVLSEADEEIRPYRCEWYLPEVGEAYVGLGLVEKVGAKIHFSSRLNGVFKVFKYDQKHKDLEDRVNFVFRLDGIDLCLSMAVEALPFSIILGRFKGHEAPLADELFKGIEGRWGQRTLYIQTDSPSLSSYRGMDLPGHCKFTLGGDGRVVKILDFNSTNHTILELPQAGQQKHLLGSGYRGDTANLRYIEQSKEIIKAGEIVSIPMPFKVFCAQVPVFVYGS